MVPSCNRACKHVIVIVVQRVEALRLLHACSTIALSDGAQIGDAGSATSDSGMDGTLSIERCSMAIKTIRNL